MFICLFYKNPQNIVTSKAVSVQTGFRIYITYMSSNVYSLIQNYLTNVVQFFPSFFIIVVQVSCIFINVVQWLQIFQFFFLFFSVILYRYILPNINYFSHFVLIFQFMSNYLSHLNSHNFFQLFLTLHINF